jgi:hypothetical protein
MQPDSALEGNDTGLALGGGDFPWPWKLVVMSSSNAETNQTPFPLSREVFPPSVLMFPVTVRELIGRRCRLITPRTVITEDFDHERLNIVLNDEGIVRDIRLG